MPGRQEYREQVERIIRLRNLTDGTIRDYLFMCNRFLDWCESINVSPQEITVGQIPNEILELSGSVDHYRSTSMYCLRIRSTRNSFAYSIS